MSGSHRLLMMLRDHAGKQGRPAAVNGGSGGVPGGGGLEAGGDGIEEDTAGGVGAARHALVHKYASRSDTGDSHHRHGGEGGERLEVAQGPKDEAGDGKDCRLACGHEALRRRRFQV